MVGHHQGQSVHQACTPKESDMLGNVVLVYFPSAAYLIDSIAKVEAHQVDQACTAKECRSQFRYDIEHE